VTTNPEPNPNPKTNPNSTPKSEDLNMVVLFLEAHVFTSDVNMFEVTLHYISGSLRLP